MEKTNRLSRLFGIKPGDKEHRQTFCPWTYIHNMPIRTAPVTCILKCTACGAHIPRLAGVNYNFCPNCGEKKTDRYERDLHPDGRTIAQTIIDEVPSTDYQKKAVEFLKELCPGYPDYTYKLTAVDLEVMRSSPYDEFIEGLRERMDDYASPYSPIEMNIKVVDEEEHKKMHEYRNS